MSYIVTYAICHFCGWSFGLGQHFFIISRKQTETSLTKKKLNKITKQWKVALGEERNAKMHEFLSGMSPAAAVDYSLWKATGNISQSTSYIAPIKTSGSQWAKTDEVKATEFAKHLAQAFEPFHSERVKCDNEIYEYFSSPFKMDFPVPLFTWKELEATINKTTKASKAPGRESPKRVPTRGYKFISYIRGVFKNFANFEFFHFFIH